ncbi:MAG: hypothetical protein HDR55_07265 [Treponema sp.]|nr:hypothetical protein [Treponema sp.]
MKKFLIVIALSAILLNFVGAQILKERSVQNTLYTGLGLPYEDDGDDGHDKFNWVGIIDTLQVRLDWQWFTIDGGLSWGLPEMNWQGSGISFLNTPDTQFDFMGENRKGYASYVNFVVRPFKNFEVGAGTRLNWQVGPSPQTGGFPWVPLAHVLQGDFAGGKPTEKAVDGKPTENAVVGKFDYAYKWADTAIAARYTIGFDKENKHYLQLGVAIPSGTTSSHFAINAAAEVKPIDLLTVAVTYMHADKENHGGNLYTGLKLDFTKIFNIEAWFGLDGIGIKKSDDVNGDKMWGTGAAVYLKFGKLPLWIKPEFGISDYLYSDYTMAIYTGGRIQWDITAAMHLGAWTSFAWGAKNDRYDYDGGFIWNIRPDFTFDINERHSVSAVFEYETTRLPNDDIYNRFCFGFYWKYNRAF